ncbi:hypothetical protein BCR42DRAFT_472194 [Absidia repens]|uniref:Uncharacterized protein n=1 Tax=Absidia repens TaxID=90262 RepID=A0A1X2I233_9FUNG|nr:hypothetical protein BCR42DRAFT_472194 [Absidia repens]
MLFTSSSKISQILEEIDTARCKGRWKAIPNLARRYVKYNPEGTGLEQLVLAEATLVQLGETKKSWDSKEVQPIQDQLQTVFELTDNTSEEHKESAKVVLARLFFGCQEYDQTLALLDGISLLNNQSSGYSFILYYQSMAIKAMSMEMMGDTQASLQTYEYISTLLDGRLPINELTLLEWAEQALYRVNQLLRNQSFSFMVDQGTVLEFMRSYHRTTCYQPVSWRTERRLDISLQMIKLLSQLYQSDEYIPYGMVDITELTDAQLRRKAFVDEITQLYTVCEHLLHETTSFPSSGESNTLILDMVESLANDLNVIMETTEDWRGFKEVLEWALEKTFNSPPILRLLFLACFQLGEYEEAQHALQSYLQSVGLVSYDRLESLKDGVALAQDIHGRYIPLLQSLPQQHQHLSNSTIRNKNSINNKQQDTDDEHVTLQLEVLLVSIKMFCKELEMGTKAVDMANMALALIQTSELVAFNPQLESQVYRSSGAAYGLLASQIVDSEQRPKYHEKALSLLQQANSILPDSWETHYYLAYQYASVRNIDLAIQSIRHSLDLNMSHVASWHLLALALSCSGQKDHSQALEIATIGLESGNDITNSRISLYEQHEQQLLLNMTYSKLVNVTKGSQKALEEHASLIKLYGKWLVEGSTTDPIDFALVDYGVNGGVDESEHAWHGRTSYGDDDKVPRKLVVSGSFGNSPSIVFSSHNHDTTSTHSTLQVPSTNTTSKSLRRRSASSSMINNFTVSGNGSETNLTNTESASVYTPSLSDNSTSKNDTLDLKSPNGSTPSTIPQRNPSLRKYASNSTLKPTGSGQSSHHHWHGIHLFPSRSTNRKYAVAQNNDNDAHSTTTTPMNISVSNDSLSRQTSFLVNGKPNSRYNSAYSIQSSTSTGPTGTATPSSLHDSINTVQTASLPMTTLPSLLIPKKQRPVMTTRGYLRHQRQHARLCELWLMSAEWYLELSESNEAIKAISEAQTACSDHPDIWCLVGQLNAQKQPSGLFGNERKLENSASPIQFFEKGLLLDPNHVGCQLGLAKLYMEQQDLCLAEGILTSLTQGFGWQSSEAWYLLGQLYRQTNRQQQTKGSLFYALDLESSRPIQPFSILPRMV